MYLEFRLPMGAGGMAAAHLSSKLRAALEKWATQHDVKYRTKVHKYTLRVTFDNDQHYTFFLTSWDSSIQNGWFKPEIIYPDKVDRYD
jgi:hypothetical protein